MSSWHQQIIGNTNSFNLSSIVNFISEGDAEGHKILQWLSPLEPQKRHQGVRAGRVDGVGNWLLETREFRKWRGEEDGCVEPVLFCYGNPGVGKTHVSSLVIDNLCDQAEGKDVAVVGVYCDFLAQEEQSTTNMLGAILKQLATRGGISDYIREAFQKAKKEFGGRGLLLPDIVDMLKKEITSLPRGYICFDALDESPPKHRQQLLEAVQEIVRVSPNTRVFLTGRPHIYDEIVRYFSKAVRIPVCPTQADIKSYLEKRLSDDTDPNAMDKKLRADIMRIIPEKISEIFLLISLNIDAILGEVTLYRRRKKLDAMTKGEGLGAAYAATLSRVKAQSGSRSKLGMEVLMWVSHAERPLHVDELCHALGVEGGSIDFNTQNIPAIETLLECALGLVTVEKSSSTVRLVHYTLQEHLSNNPDLFLDPHSVIAEVCLTYLNFRYIRDISPALRAVPPTAALVEYASCHWGSHARRGDTERVKALAMELLDEYDTHISSKMLLLRGAGFWAQPFDQEDTPRGFTGLHGAAYFGCLEITVALLEANKWDAQATDFNGNTAIAWAARRGHERVVRVLLQRGNINPNITNTIYGQTPLLLAARDGYGGVVRILLEWSEVNPEKADKWSRTPLLLAAENGHQEVVRMLLDRNDIDPDKEDDWSQTPLLRAAENGHQRVVRMLLGQKLVNPNKADRRSQTPLLLAARNGHEGVVKMLLGQNVVNPHNADDWSQTPLSWAAKNGHEGVVKMLLRQKEINPNTEDTTPGETLLLLAAKNGHDGVVRILLEQSNVNPDIADDEYGQTPLSCAAENGRVGVVRILLERNDVNPDKADKLNRTPLWWALENGHERIAELLQERTDPILKPAASLNPTGPVSPAQSELPQHSSKKVRRS